MLQIKSGWEVASLPQSIAGHICCFSGVAGMAGILVPWWLVWGFEVVDAPVALLANEQLFFTESFVKVGGEKVMFRKGPGTQ